MVPFAKNILYYPLENYKDTEDGILYLLASKAKMNYFITRNVKDFNSFSFIASTKPNQFFKRNLL